MKPGAAEHWVRAMAADDVKRDPLWSTCLMLALRCDTLDEQIEMLTARITQFELGKQRKFLRFWGWRC